MVSRLDSLQNWTADHFLIYMYLCVVGADKKMADSEIDVMLDKIDELNLDEKYKFTDLFGEILNEYNRLEENQRFELISVLYSKFNLSKVQKERLILNLHNLIEADGTVMEQEKDMYFKITDLLKNK